MKEKIKNRYYNISNQEFKMQVIKIKRVSKRTQGGKILSFRVIVIVGNKNGKIGLGIAKAKNTRDAIKKATNRGYKNIFKFPRTKKATIPHHIIGTHRASKVFMKPSIEGSGIIAGGTVRNILNISGIENIITKQIGSDNILNNTYAVINGLKNLLLKIKIKYALKN
uniref:Small ribosomal subunit protein uS5m n=1 Tax=Nitzschia alba TaxID=2858 RepID=A0A5C0F3R4_NITAL|nr:30S ribosomal protein S5 [Nitzschia alba]QEI59601.1 30S ribosomal protein S5 [Nitzschia alba]